MGSEAWAPGSGSDLVVIMGGVAIPIGGGAPGGAEEFSAIAMTGEEFQSKIPGNASGGGVVIMGGVAIPIGATDSDYSGEETAALHGSEEFSAALA